MTTPSAPADNDLEAYEVAKVVRLTNPNPFVNGGASKPPAPRKRGVCKIALLAALLVLVVIGFGGGGFALGRATHPSCDDDDDDGYTITIDVDTIDAFVDAKKAPTHVDHRSDNDTEPKPEIV